MKKINQIYYLVVSATLLLTLGLAGCGGGSDETVTMTKILPPEGLVKNAPCVVIVAIEGCSPVLSMLPENGGAKKHLDGLTRAGVAVSNSKCGTLFDAKDANGFELIRAGGFPTYIVLADIPSSGLDRAKALGFEAATEDYLKNSVRDTFDCESRRL